MLIPFSKAKDTSAVRRFQKDQSLDEVAKNHDITGVLFLMFFFQSTIESKGKIQSVSVFW